MNVAQAAAVLLYLCAREPAPASSPQEAGADGALLQRLEGKLEAALTAAEFLNPQAPGHVLKELSRSLVHGKLTQREAQLWLSAFEHLRRVVQRS
jgi:tRNA/rRNA methyltransferase